ncbi:DmsE family decaheme c-type cytochrome [Halorhodospira sp. 9621]|uniref:DmsE family decaheme c-type cytochrome n=1 Tax=Halorhodospira sp. 9621 TaxID=2899135 RepID=UPI001EE91B30|nr:DmsE family decaheme c-type cytochrome [Halorhodospira sp. 9621]MCG5532991.1 DmsE family decaheme c-type cytochrome [Halorhodospira sp. 9621]
MFRQPLNRLAISAGGVAALFALLLFAATAPAQDLDPEEIEEFVEEVRGLSPVMAERRVDDLRAHIGRMEETPHAVASDPRTPAGQTPEDGNYCYQCHGDGWEHFYQIGEDISTDEANQTCLDCHSGGDRMHWHGGAHEFQDMACVDCHNMHGENERLLHTENELQLCASCHQERRVDFNRPHHHPVEEGQVTCTNCHNPHGTGGESLLREGQVNETCYNCHAEYRGPFLWEHMPVREDCTNCHDPHGSVHPNLLEARPTQLCQSCHLHSPGGHPGVDPADFEGGGWFGPGPADDGRLVFGRGCLNCHSDIHGSNHPGGDSFRP